MVGDHNGSPGVPFAFSPFFVRSTCILVRACYWDCFDGSLLYLVRCTGARCFIFGFPIFEGATGGNIIKPDSDCNV